MGIIRAAPYTGLLVSWIVAFALAVILLARYGKSAVAGGAVLGATAVLVAGAVAVPPQRSGDLWEYAFAGRLVAHEGVSPYTRVPADYPYEPTARRVRPEFRSTPSVYGPLFVGISAAGMSVAGTSALKARLFFQGLAGLCVLIAVMLVWRRTRSPAAAAFVGFNPVTIIGLVNNAHNDAVAGVLVLCAVLLIDRRLLAFAGAVAGAAVAVKATALIPLAALALWSWKTARPARAGAVRIVLGAAGVLVVAYALGGGGAAIRATFSGAGAHVSAHSIWFRPLLWLHHGFDARTIVSVAGLAVTAVVGGMLAARSTRNAAQTVAAWFVVYLLAGAYVLPWYAGIVLPAAALALRSPASWLIAAHACVLMLVYRSGSAPVMADMFALFEVAALIWLVARRDTLHKTRS